MTTSMKLFIFLWLVMVLRVAAALLGGRQCLRIRHLTTYRQIYEWMTAFGIGMILWGISDLGAIWNSIVNGPPNRDQYPTKTLWYSIIFQLLQTGAVWLITLVLLNGGVPGFVRINIFWILTKLHIMDPFQETRPDLPTPHTTE